MRIPNLRRITAFSLIAALLAVGGMACIFAGNDDATTEIIDRLDAVEAQSRDSLINLELLTADVTRLKENNLELTARVDQLQQDKDAQATLITTLQAQVAAGGTAAAANPAAMDDATALNRFIECTVKTANPGANAAVIALASGAAQTSLTAQIQGGSMTYDTIRAMIPSVCAGQ